MVALGIAGCVVAGLAFLLFAVWVLLVLRQVRADRPPAPPSYRPSAPSRRLADSRRHPDDPATVELPAIQEEQ